ncbi:MAG: hypothetical protein COV48_01075 [Elusimicrobia bacterium CG11_big_fil_rev_8_21_14_0_20_64_6]|nr:MAG: hypothetical protein COV48_01075 [Elusimicrobia bacterium CG11_big_fil_rev_8_21_14_0_20_64_6]
MLALFIPMGQPVLGADAKSEHARWQLVGHELQLVDEQKAVRKMFSLSRLFKNKVWRETNAFVSDTGLYAAVGEAQMGSASSTSTLTFLDTNGTTVWAMKAVDLTRVLIANDGARTLLVTSIPDVCSEEDEICSKTVVLLDEAGHPVAKFGPYRIIDGISLTKNGKYGYASVWKLGIKGNQHIFFNAAGRVLTPKGLTKIPGAPTLQEDGTIEFIELHYAPHEKGKVPKVVRSEVVNKFKLE